MINENTTTKPSDSDGVSSSDLLALIHDQISRYYEKARVLDGMKMGLEQTSDNVSEHKRLSIKSGVYRSSAHDLSNSLKMLLS